MFCIIIYDYVLKSYAHHAAAAAANVHHGRHWRRPMPLPLRWPSPAARSPSASGAAPKHAAGVNATVRAALIQWQTPPPRTHRQRQREVGTAELAADLGARHLEHAVQIVGRLPVGVDQRVQQLRIVAGRVVPAEEGPSIVG